MKDCDGYFFIIYDVSIEKAMDFGHNGDKQPAWLKDSHGGAASGGIRMNHEGEELENRAARLADL